MNWGAAFWSDGVRLLNSARVIMHSYILPVSIRRPLGSELVLQLNDDSIVPHEVEIFLAVRSTSLVERRVQ